MTRSKLITCCVWLLGGAIAMTGLMAGLDHWGGYRRFAKRGRARAQMPVDVIGVDPSSKGASPHAASSYATSQYAGAQCICSHCHCALDDDFAGDEPDEPTSDSLILWLCDDGGVQKQFALEGAHADELSVALADDQTRRVPSDEQGLSTLSLSSLHVRLQI